MAYRLYPYPAEQYIFELTTYSWGSDGINIRINMKSSDTHVVYHNAFNVYDTGDVTIPTAKVLHYGIIGMSPLEDCRIYNDTPYVLHVQCWENGHHADMDSGDWEADVPAGENYTFDLDNVDLVPDSSYALITVKGFPSDYIYGNLKTAILKKI